MLAHVVKLRTDSDFVQRHMLSRETQRALVTALL
jgi:hypothetical protein